MIIYYDIQLTETETGTEFQWTSPELTTTRGSLHPHFHYEFRVAARTSVGTGPSSAVETVQTLPAGMPLLFLLHVIYCLWPLRIVPHAAPTAAPTQLRVSNFDSSTIALVWEPPPFTDRNGDIVRYHLRVTEQETQTMFEYSSTSQRYTLTSLHPYYNYVISIAAETVGVGPFTSGLLQQTMESGEFHAQSYRPDTLPEVWHKTLGDIKIIMWLPCLYTPQFLAVPQETFPWPLLILPPFYCIGVSYRRRRGTVLFRATPFVSQMLETEEILIIVLSRGRTSLQIFIPISLTVLKLLQLQWLVLVLFLLRLK